MNRVIGIALLAVGIVLLVLGISSSNSIGSDFSRFFTGSPTNKTVWFLVIGAVSVVTGSVVSLMKQPR